VSFNALPVQNSLRIAGDKVFMKSTMKLTNPNFDGDFDGKIKVGESINVVQ